MEFGNCRLEGYWNIMNSPLDKICLIAIELGQAQHVGSSDFCKQYENRKNVHQDDSFFASGSTCCSRIDIFKINLNVVIILFY